jgi:hypothetical protein
LETTWRKGVLPPPDKIQVPRCQVQREDDDVSAEEQFHWKMILENIQSRKRMVFENACTSIGTQIQMHVILPAVRW